MLLYFSNCLSFGLPKEKKKKKMTTKMCLSGAVNAFSYRSVAMSALAEGISPFCALKM